MAVGERPWKLGKISFSWGAEDCLSLFKVLDPQWLFHSPDKLGEESARDRKTRETETKVQTKRDREVLGSSERGTGCEWVGEPGSGWFAHLTKSRGRTMAGALERPPGARNSGV